MEFSADLTATYRLQFHADFDFAAGAAQASYLAALGVSHVYASPIMQATPGSRHGYDMTDFARVNAELGGEAGFRALAARLRAQGLGIILDIVPNHMAVGGAHNPYWLDLLAKGRDSAYADFFDVDFDAPGMDGKILAPFLGAPYEEILRKGEIALKPRGEGFALVYGDHVFPLREADQAAIRAQGVAAWAEPERLRALIAAQPYRLAWWRAANDRLNFRRFFEITTLAGVRIEKPEAFDKVHALPLAFYAEGLIDGVRVDHIDGLTDPAGYAARLHAALAARRGERPEGRRGPAYVIVEKILAGEEVLPRWPIHGTSGYDFMNEVSALQHDEAGAAPLRAHWAELSGRAATFEPEEAAARAELLDRNFAGQLEALVETLQAAALALEGPRDLTQGEMRRAVVAVIGGLRVYRSYAVGGPDNPGAGPDLAQAFARAAAAPTRDDEALKALRGIIDSRSDAPVVAEAIRRFHQLCAPVAAKAVEDTAFYRHMPLLSRNDVGFDPAHFGREPGEFHARMAARARDWPHAMLTTATHDHKRGEDARARLAVLSEIPEVWILRARAWSALNAPLRAQGFDAADEYALFQTLVGVWPPGLAADDRAGLAALAERVADWQVKALREGKLRSSWLTPSAAYEEVAQTYLRAALDPARSAAFLADLAGFVAALAPAGISNALAQAALRCLLPGVPDLYQGAEFWDFSLVDPDNRRPVDFAARALRLETGGALATGAPKQAMIRRLLRLRSERRELFAFGDYTPVAVEGAPDVLAFVRRRGAEAVVAAIAPRRSAALFGARDIGAQDWGEARLAFDLGGFAPVVGGGEGPRLADIFRDGPVAVWAR